MILRHCPECEKEMYYIYRWQCSGCEYEEFETPLNVKSGNYHSCYCGDPATHQCLFTSNEVCTTWLCDKCKHEHPEREK